MKTTTVVPYGVLTTQNGHAYYLLASEPVEPEDWMQEPQQKYLVASYFAPHQKQYLITTFPDILLYSDTTKSIQILGGVEYA